MAIQGLLAGASLLPSAFKAWSAIKQRREASKINPTDPGYQMNNAIIDNARVLGERYSNYQLPGASQMRANVNSSFGNAYAQGSQGASSGGDLLDLASRLGSGQTQALNTIDAQAGAGRDAALLQSLDANAMAGNEGVLKNRYDQEQYQRQLQEKAALLGASNQNAFSALNEVGKGITALSYRPDGTVGSAAPNVTPLGSSFSVNKAKRLLSQTTNRPI